MPCSACPNEKVFASGLCSGCYNRQRRRGTTERKNVVNSGNCLAPGCDRQAFSKNLCSMHYYKQRHPLIGTWRTLRSRAIEGFPESWRTFEGFLAEVGERPSPTHQLRRPDPTKAWGPENCVWRTPVGVKWKGNTADYQRRWHLRNRYGLTVEQVEVMAKAQDGRCAICRATLCADGAKVCIDHDHVSRRVRGLLCDPCNKAIGQMNDDPPRLRAAATYLEAHAGDTSAPCGATKPNGKQPPEPLQVSAT